MRDLKIDGLKLYAAKEMRLTVTWMMRRTHILCIKHYTSMA